MRASLARGVVTVISTPAIVVFSVLSVFVGWLLLVAVGFQGPLSPLTAALAVPPVGTVADSFLSQYTFSLKTSFYAGFAVIAVHAIFLAVLTAMSVQAISDGEVTRSVTRQALRVFPTTLLVGFVSAFGLLASQLIVAIIGPGIGLVLLLLGFIVGVSWLGFAPAAVLLEEVPSVYSVGISMRAARIPGTNSLSLAALYSVGSLAVLIGSTRSLGGLDVNPSAADWAVVLIANLLHAVFVATLAYRFMAIAPDVPPPAPRRR